MCEYTMEEVGTHCTKRSCWIVVHDEVYDVTDFIDEHPGGGEVLLEHAGADATDAFEDVGHTQDARDLAKQYLIGTIANQNKTNKDKVEGSEDKQQEEDSSWSCTVS